MGLGFQSYTYSLGGVGVVVAMEDIALLRNVELSKMPPRSRDWKKRKPLQPGKRGTRSSGARKYTAVEPARARIIVASEDFAPLPFLCPVGL